MTAILDNINTLLPWLLGPWGLVFFFTRIRPQRMTNSVLLMFALMMTVLFVCGLFGEWSGYALVVAFLLACLVVFLVPAFLIWNGAVMLRKESRSLSNMLSIFVGLFVAAGEIAAVIIVLNSVDFVTLGNVSPFVVFIFASVFYISFWILTFVLYILFIQIMPHGGDFDYVIIHGCGLIGGEKVSRLLSNRLDRAIDLYNAAATKPVLIASGGKGSDEALSEAAAMSAYLVDHGVAQESILVEDGSTTTMENLKNCKALIDGRETQFGQSQDNQRVPENIDKSHKCRIALVSSNYHVYRCLLYAARLKMKCVGVGAKVAFYYWPGAVLREFAAVFTRLPHIIWLFLGYILFVVLPIVI